MVRCLAKEQINNHRNMFSKIRFRFCLENANQLSVKSHSLPVDNAKPVIKCQAELRLAMGDVTMCVISFCNIAEKLITANTFPGHTRNIDSEKPVLTVNFFLLSSRVLNCISRILFSLNRLLSKFMELANIVALQLNGSWSRNKGLK